MKGCSICASPVQAAVNDAHEKGSTLREIQKLSGGTLTRASLSRHFRNCLNRVRIAQHGSFACGRLLRKNPGGGFYDQNTFQDVPNSQVRDNDVELIIEYEKPRDVVPNPYALLTKEQRAAYDAEKAATEAAEIAAALNAAEAENAPN
jgi:hypothetical protein